jgi:hemerythrin-like domain-containing protein
MCEYCGCQEVSAIARLTEEHDTVVNLIEAARSALDRGEIDRAAANCRRMLSVLVPHVRVEEEGLFPPMRDEFPEQVDQLRAEHRAIEAVLEEAAEATPTDPTWPGRLREAMHQLREHILKEQDGVFPAALATLEPGDWDRLDQIRARLVVSTTALV